MEELGQRERNRRRTWQALREHGLRLVGERGYDAVSVDEIAAAAGVGRRTFFNYFATKEALLLDPDPSEPAVWKSILDSRPADEPVWLSLRQVLLEYTGRYLQRLVAHKRMAAASPRLARSSRDSTSQFWLLVGEWVRHRVGRRRELSAALLTASARTVLRTAMDSWEPEQGLRRFHTLIRAGFAQLGSGLDQLSR